MRVTSILFAGVFALVASAQTTVNSTPTMDPATAAQASNQAESLRCIEACKAGDVDCTSKCIAVPNPNEEQVILPVHRTSPMCNRGIESPTTLTRTHRFPVLPLMNHPIIASLPANQTTARALSREPS